LKIILKNDFIHLNIHFSEAALPAVLACVTPMFVTLCHDYNTYSHNQWVSLAGWDEYCQ